MQSSSGLQTKQKGLCKYDVCTEADLRIQSTIQHNLKALFPRARVICEEEDSSIDESMAPSLQPDQVLKIMKHKSYFTPEILSYQANVRRLGFERYLNDLSKLGEGKFSEASDVQRGMRTLTSGFENEIKEDELTFWVDPLDGSSGLAQGHTEHLTCIIGVAVNKRPLLGIVHKPFSQTRTPGTTVGRTYIGLPESGLFTIGNNFSDSGRAIPFKEGEAVPHYEAPFSKDKRPIKPVVCGSHNTNQGIMDKVIFSLEPEKVERVAGSGNKFVHMVDGQSDFYINLVPGFKHWDMCGSEAILQSRFGLVTDAQQGPLSYDHETTQHTLKNGIIASKSKRQLDTLAGRIEDSLGQSID